MLIEDKTPQAERRSVKHKEGDTGEEERKKNMRKRAKARF